MRLRQSGSSFIAHQLFRHALTSACCTPWPNLGRAGWLTTASSVLGIPLGFAVCFVHGYEALLFIPNPERPGIRFDSGCFLNHREGNSSANTLLVPVPTRLSSATSIRLFGLAHNPRQNRGNNHRAPYRDLRFKWDIGVTHDKREPLLNSLLPTMAEELRLSTTIGTLQSHVCPKMSR
jgi:hypothetical protein